MVQSLSAAERVAYAELPAATDSDDGDEGHHGSKRQKGEGQAAAGSSGAGGSPSAAMLHPAMPQLLPGAQSTEQWMLDDLLKCFGTGKADAAGGVSQASATHVGERGVTAMEMLVIAAGMGGGRGVRLATLEGVGKGDEGGRPQRRSTRVGKGMRKGQAVEVVCTDAERSPDGRPMGLVLSVWAKRPGGGRTECAASDACTDDVHLWAMGPMYDSGQVVGRRGYQCPLNQDQTLTSPGTGWGPEDMVQSDL